MSGGRPRVLIGSRSFGRRFPEHLQMLVEAGCEVVPNTVGRGLRAEELGQALVGVTVIITGTDELTAEVIAGARDLRAIVKHGVGLDNVDLSAARARGIAVVAAPGTMDDSVADMTLALILAAARGVVAGHVAVAAGGWSGPTGVELAGRTLGIVGYGRIGRAVARRARAFGMAIAAHDPFLDASAVAEDDVTLMDLPALLAASHVVSLHAAAGGDVILDATALRSVRPGAIVVNTARGSLVDEHALAAALDAGRLAGAAVDVLAEEPPHDSPLVGRPDVVITPHVAGRTEEALRRMGEVTVAHCLQALGRHGAAPVAREVDR